MTDRLVAAGVAALLALVHAQRASAWLGAARSAAPAERQRLRIYLACATVFLIATPLAGPHGDYGAYQRFWARVHDGTDPWLGTPVNAYGPLFNILAVFTPVSWLVPKVLFAFAYVLVVSWLTLALPARLGRDVPWGPAMAGLLNPVAWIEQVYWGNFDVLAGAACVMAVDACLRGRERTAGTWLALGAGVKMLPALVLPALLMDRGRVRSRLVLWTTALTAVVFGASVLVWGLDATLRPFTFAAARRSQNSIFSFLRGPLSPLHLVWPAADADWLSTPLLVLTVAGVALRLARLQAGAARAGLAGVLAALLFYRTGLVRYQMMLIPLVACWWIVEGPQVAGRTAVRWWAAAWAAWLTFSDVTGWLAAVTWNGTSEPAVVRTMELVSGRAWGPVMLVLELSLLVLLLSSTDATVPLDGERATAS